MAVLGIILQAPEGPLHWPQLLSCRMLRNKDSAKGQIPRPRVQDDARVWLWDRKLPGASGDHSGRLFLNLLDKGWEWPFRLPDPRKWMDLGPGFKGTSGIQKTGPHIECPLDHQRFHVPSMAGTEWHSP